MKEFYIFVIFALLIVGFGKGIMIGIDDGLVVARVIEIRERHKAGYVYQYRYYLNKKAYEGELDASKGEMALDDEIWVRYSKIFPSISSYRFSISIFENRIFHKNDSVSLYKDFFPEKLNNK